MAREVVKHASFARVLRGFHVWPWVRPWNGLTYPEAGSPQWMARGEWGEAWGR